MGTAEGFNAGLAWHPTQRNPLGRRYKIDGRTWEYIEVKDTWDAGNLVESESTRDVSSQTGDTITVATATAIGGDTLIAGAGTFTDKEIVGAVGMILAGGALGTSFEVTEWVSATTIRIRVISQLTGRVTDGKLKAATTTSSTFSLVLPGKAVKGASDSRRASGFSQIAAASTDKGKFGFVLAKGRGLGRLDYDGQDLGGIDRAIVKADGGLVQGLPATASSTFDDDELTAALNIPNRFVGYSTSPNFTATANGLIVIDAACPDHWYAALLPYLEHAENKVTIG